MAKRDGRWVSRLLKRHKRIMVMQYFKKEEMIRCYRERKEDRCKECKLAHAAMKLPYGIEENAVALVENVLDPARRKFGKMVYVNSGFRCPLHNSKVGGESGSQHMKGEAADLSCGDNQKLARIIVENGKWDQMIIYPTFLHISWKRQGVNRKEVLKKTAKGYERVEASSL